LPDSFVNAAYLLAATLFILGLRGLSGIRTARRGNALSSLGMLLAVVITLVDRKIISYELIVIGLGIGTALGAFLALRVHMTAMPQLVAAFNGLGGGASALVAGSTIASGTAITVELQAAAAGAVSAFVGAVTFAGSIVAWSKLQEKLDWQPRNTPAQHVANGALVAGACALIGLIIFDSSWQWPFWALVGIATLLGLRLTLPIGGADMPVVIALLNSASGLAAATTGFVLNNNVLIIGGALVGASGFILTTLMSRAMNRSVASVLFGTLGPAEGGPGDEIYEGRVTSASAAETAMLLGDARSVLIVPGYGMAVAQAQHAVRDLTEELESRGINVKYAIHPVAGRMPGHMNVLLAEADVPYEQLYDLENLEGVFEKTDVALVIGANDVVNPLAREDPSSPIYGMPIIDVDRARTVVVIKRSLSPGFAGIPNSLFAADNTLMLFGDGDTMVRELIGELKTLG
jgi:NAD(P) transhydrogenase subunit beta